MPNSVLYAFAILLIGFGGLLAYLMKLADDVEQERKGTIHDN